MTPEEFAAQLGELKGLMTAVRDNQAIHQARTESLHQQQAEHIEAVRSQLSSKIDSVEARTVKAIDATNKRLDDVDTRTNKRVDTVETQVTNIKVENAKRSVQAGLAAGGVSAVAVALAIKLGEAILKLTGGQ